MLEQSQKVPCSQPSQDSSHTPTLTNSLTLFQTHPEVKTCVTLMFIWVFVVSQRQQDIPHFIMLCFNALRRYCFSFRHELKICGNPVLSKSIGAIFPTAWAHFVSMYHIFIIIVRFQAFSLLLCLLW